MYYRRWSGKKINSKTADMSVKVSIMQYIITAYSRRMAKSEGTCSISSIWDSKLGIIPIFQSFSITVFLKIFREMLKF